MQNLALKTTEKSSFKLEDYKEKRSVAELKNELKELVSLYKKGE